LIESDALITKSSCCIMQHSAVSVSGQCHEVYATVKERATGRIDTICASRVRFSEVYRCQDTSLEIRILPGSGARARYFLLKYQGIKCPCSLPTLAVEPMRV